MAQNQIRNKTNKTSMGRQVQLQVRVKLASLTLNLFLSRSESFIPVLSLLFSVIIFEQIMRK